MSTDNQLPMHSLCQAPRNPRIGVTLHRRLLPGVCVLATALLLLSCGDGGDKTPTAPPAPVMVLTTVTVSLSVSTIQAGQTATATATGADQTGGSISTGAVSWSSSSTTVATISAGGAIAAVAAGQTTISAAAGSRTGTATLTVIPVPVASVAVSPATGTIIVGATLQLSASASDASGAALTGRLVTWSSADSGKARVSTTGLVTGVAEGGAIITATCEGRSATALITVQPRVSRVVLSAAAITLDAIGATQLLVATPQNATGAAVTDVAVVWTTSAASVASVSASGLVTSVSNGSAVITATALDKSATATVTVAQVASRLAVIDGTPSVLAGQPLVPPFRVRLLDRLGVAAALAAGTATASALSGAISGLSSVAIIGGEASFDDLRFPSAGTTRVRFAAGGGIPTVDTSVVVLDQPIGTLRVTAGSGVGEGNGIQRLNPLVEAVDSTGKVLNVTGVVRATIVRGVGEIVSGDTVTLVAGSARYAALRVRSPASDGMTLGFSSSVLSQGSLGVGWYGSGPFVFLLAAVAADSVVARDSNFALDIVLAPFALPVGVVRADVAFDSSRVALVSDSVVTSSGTMARSPTGSAVGSYTFSYIHTTGQTATITLLRLRFRARTSGMASVDLLLSQLATPLGVSYAPVYTTSTVRVRIP